MHYILCQINISNSVYFPELRWIINSYWFAMITSWFLFYIDDVRDKSFKVLWKMLRVYYLVFFFFFPHTGKQTQWDQVPFWGEKWGFTSNCKWKIFISWIITKFPTIKQGIAIQQGILQGSFLAEEYKIDESIVLTTYLKCKK